MLRLVAAPVIGQVAERFGAARGAVALFGFAAGLSCGHLLGSGSVPLLALSLLKAFATAPLAPLSAALPLSAATRERSDPARFRAARRPQRLYHRPARAARSYAEAAALPDRHPDLTAIYNMGAGSAEVGRERGVVCVGHEVADSTRDLLLDAVIDQNARVEAREALNVLSHRIGRLPYTDHPPGPQMVFRDNIPEP